MILVLIISLEGRGADSSILSGLLLKVNEPSRASSTSMSRSVRDKRFVVECMMSWKGAY